jgi:hypothetical protein
VLVRVNPPFEPHKNPFHYGVRYLRTREKIETNVRFKLVDEKETVRLGEESKVRIENFLPPWSELQGDRT